MLGESMVPMLQRFYLVIAILVNQGSGELTRSRLEILCQQSAERLARVIFRGPQAMDPEFVGQSPDALARKPSAGLSSGGL